ncbi:MAG: C40 family peptidase [Simplicispira sp.]|nr:C40 family peptidase [Simplicispira sp.]
MSKWFCTFLLVFASAAHAAPTNDTIDAIDRFLSEKGLMTQLDAVRHDVADKTSGLVVTAMGLLGVPYRRGGSSSETGFDCSGFVRSIYSQTVGLALPRRAEQQAAATQTIDKKELQPGDLVFFNTMRRAFSHVGIYIGDGKFVHSPSIGGKVRVEEMQAAYWKLRFNGARRVVSESLQAQAPLQAND